MKSYGLYIRALITLPALAIIFFFMGGLNGFRQGLDLAGGVRITYQIDFSEYENVIDNEAELISIKREVLNIIIAKIDRRVGGLGVSDYKVYPQTLQNEEYITIELGGIDDLAVAKETIGKTLELTFMVPYETQPIPSIVNERSQQLEQKISNPDQSLLPTATSIRDDIYIDDFIDELPSSYGITGDNSTINQGRYPEVISGVTTPPPYLQPAKRIINITDISGTGSDLLISGRSITYANTPTRVPIKDTKTERILNGAYFQMATVTQNQLGQPAVSLDMTDEGTALLCTASKKILKSNDRTMAIFVGNNPASIATVEEELCGGASISGDFTPQEAQELQDNLNDGAFPAPLILSQEEVISSTLGEEAMRGSAIAGIVAIFGVSLFLITQYGRRFGIVGSMVLTCYIFTIVAITKILQYNYSLSGIAAIILSIGMAVDAIIIIFSRIEEEMQQKSQSIQNAITHGYQYSISAIRDGNITTGIIGLILFIVGTNFFKGFGSMLLITIALTLGLIMPLTKSLLLSIASRLYQRIK